MKLAFFELEGWEDGMIQEKFPGHELFLTKEKLTNASIPAEKAFDIVSVFVNSKVDEAILNQLGGVKYITTRSTGYDHIDVNTCRAKGIQVAYVPGYGDNTVAEFAFGLILALTRKLYLAIDQIKEKGSFALEGLRGIDLRGKTLGVLGTGRIGKEAIRMGKGFGMNVIAFDLFPNQEAAEVIGFQYDTLENVLGAADVITVHAPLTKQTEHLINVENISLIKRGAYLVNTARGPIVETEAIVKGLENGILAGVGLDVLEEEGEIKDEMKFLSEGKPHESELKIILQNHILMKMPNVLITPHNAFNTQEAMERILDTTFKNIESYIEGNPLNLVPEQ